MLLELIREHAGITRQGLAAISGMSRSTIADTVAELLRAGIVIEEDSEVSQHGPGRRPTLLRATPPPGMVAGIDFGHAHVRVAVALTDGTIIAEDTHRLDVDDNAVLALDTSAEMTATLLERAGAAPPTLLAVGAGIPGPLNHDGLVSSATILSSWVGLAPAVELAARLECKVAVSNDAEMGALGEWRFGAGRTLSDFIYIKASHGVGAAMVLDRRLYRGVDGAAGEIGHTYLPEAVERCRCGKQGCLEAAVSVDRVREQLGHTALRTAESAAGLALTDADSDPVGARVLADAGRTVGRVVAAGCNWLNPQAVVLGGELGASGISFVAGFRDSLDRYAEASVASSVRVVPAELGGRAELMGAVAAAVDCATNALAAAQ